MSPKRYLGSLRVVLLLVGAATFVCTVGFGASLPEPPPDSDGVPAGFAVVFVLLIQFAATLIALVGYGLPPGTGRFRFGPLADRSAVVRVAGATLAFTGTTLLLTVLGWILPDSLPGAVDGAYAFTWLGVAVGTVTGVALTLVVAVGTALWRLARGDPILGVDDG